MLKVLKKFKILVENYINRLIFTDIFNVLLVFLKLLFSIGSFATKI